MSVTANNRFLSKTNPQLIRALADSGSSLNHPEIQRLARQQVDLGIWGNLKLWVHRDLVKTRTSGSDLFVPKAYDMSGNNNDAAQTTEANQPKLLSTGMEFDGSNDYFNLGAINLYISTSFSLMAWCYFNTGGLDIQQIISKDTTFEVPPQREFQFRYSDNRIEVYRFDSSNNFLTDSGIFSNTISTGAWLMIFCSWNNSSGGQMYINGSTSGSANTASLSDNKTGSSANLMIGGRIGATLGNFIKANSNDIRIYNTALTADQISAIYNESKSYYGL